VKLGGDPAGDKADSRVRAAETFEPVMHRFLSWQQARLRPRSYDEVYRHLAANAKPLHGLALAKIDRRTVAALLSELSSAHSANVADAVRSSLSHMFAWAMREGLIDNNPIIGTNRAGPPSSRDRVLSRDELRAIWHALPANNYGDILKLLLLTGQRRNEIGSLRWEEIDFANALITLPATRTKNHREHTVPLSPPALAILQTCPEREFVFGRVEGRGFSGWGSKARLVLPIKPWRVHDLRRTCSTIMHDELGVPPHIVEAVLNHVGGHKSGVAGTYNRALYANQKAQALQQWGEWVLAVVT
jgi:integrase